MSRELVDPSFEEWLVWVFDHPVRDPAWHFDVDADWWDESRDPSRTVEYLTRLFLAPGLLPRRFSDAQTAQGLNFLVSPACSDHMFALMDPAVPWERREHGIRVITALFRELFAERCTHHFGHLDAGPEAPNPLNGVCYMWWDVCPLPFNENEGVARATHAVVLEVLRGTLRLPSPACRESALHGLGHLHYQDPAQVERIIDGFLGRERSLPPALRQYALNARRGCVL